LTSTQKFVLFAIHSFTKTDTATAFPGVETLARRTQFTVRTVVTAIGQLEDMGWLLVTRAPWKSGQKRQTNLYVVMVPHPKSVSSVSSLSSKACCEVPRFG